MLLMARIGGNECGILRRSAFHLYSLWFDLPLQSVPDDTVTTGLGQAFTEQPDRRGIRQVLRESREVHERCPVLYLLLRLLVHHVERAPQEEDLDHGGHGNVRSCALVCIVVVQHTDQSIASFMYARGS